MVVSTDTPHFVIMTGLNKTITINDLAMNRYPTIPPFSLPHLISPLQSHFHVYDSSHNFNFLPPPSMPALSLTLGSTKMSLIFDFPSMPTFLHLQVSVIYCLGSMECTEVAYTTDHQQ